MKQFNTFTGGPFDTNAFFLEAAGGNILFDAPQGADEHFAGKRVDWILLTHGHFDHVADVAKMKRRHGCRIAYHQDTAPMVTDGSFFRRHGFQLDIEPFTADLLIPEGEGFEVAGHSLKILHVPGHCPGSVCFYFAEFGVLIGGDVLFNGGVGRWDLPGGDGELLFEGIRRKVFSLPDETVVLPGHGPSTTVGHERLTNPYVAG